MSSPINAGQSTQIPTASEDSKDLLSLPFEMFLHITSFINIFELPRLSLTCSRMQGIVESSIIQRVREFGGENKDSDTAMKSLKSFFYFCKLVERKAIIKTFLVQKEDEIDVNASYQKIINLPPDEAAQFNIELNKQLLFQLNPPVEKNAKVKHSELEKTVLALLELGADPDLKSELGEPILCVAARHGHKGIGALLLKKGAKVNPQDDVNQAPLHLAAQHGHKDNVKLLLEKGAKVDIKGYNGRTPLHYAAASGQKDIAAFLIEQGANVEAKDNDGKTPLHFVVTSDQKDTIALLIEQGANVEAKDNDGKTPLHFVVWQGRMDKRDQETQKDIAVLLIKKGANINEQDNEDNMPLYKADNRWAKDLVALLQNAAQRMS